MESEIQRLRKSNSTWANLAIVLASGYAHLACSSIMFLPGKRLVDNPIEQVQQGYIAPSRIEFICEDLDRNGELETIMRIDDNNYLLREINGKPVILSYEVRPPEVIVRE